LSLVDAFFSARFMAIPLQVITRAATAQQWNAECRTKA